MPHCGELQFEQRTDLIAVRRAEKENLVEPPP